MTKLDALNKIIVDKLGTAKEGTSILEALNFAVAEYGGPGNAKTNAEALEQLYEHFDKGGGGGGGTDSPVVVDFSQWDNTQKEELSSLGIVPGGVITGVITEVDYNGLDLQGADWFPGLMGAVKLNKVSFKGIKNSGNVASFCGFMAGAPLKAIDLSGLDFSSCKNLWGAFAGCSKLENLDLSMIRKAGTGVGDSIQMNGAFVNCKSLKTLDVSGIDFKYCVLDQTFTFCSSLTHITFGDFPDQFFIAAEGGWYDSAVDFGSSPLDHETALHIINHAADVSGHLTEETPSLVFSAVTFATLTEDEIAIATAKGWTVPAPSGN